MRKHEQGNREVRSQEHGKPEDKRSIGITVVDSEVTMESYVGSMKETLRHATGQRIEAFDCSDDRLAHLLKHLSKQKYWHGIEQALNERSLEVYDLPQEVARCDATTVSGDHEVTEGERIQFGYSKEDPTCAQLKVMLGLLDRLGIPLATEVVSGEQAFQEE